MEHCQECGKTADHIKPCEKVWCPVGRPERSPDKCGEVEIGYYVEIKRGSWAKENGKLAQTFPASGLSYSGSLTKEQMEGIDGLIRDYLEGKTTPSHALPSDGPGLLATKTDMDRIYKPEDFGIDSAPSTTRRIRRFRASVLDGYANIKEHPEGTYCLYSEVEQLERELAATHDMVTLTARQRDEALSAASATREIERLRAFQRDTQEAEARCCPEDFGFEEWISILVQRAIPSGVAELCAEHDALIAAESADGRQTAPSDEQKREHSRRSGTRAAKMIRVKFAIANRILDTRLKANSRADGGKQT